MLPEIEPAITRLDEPTEAQCISMSIDKIAMYMVEPSITSTQLKEMATALKKLAIQVEPLISLKYYSFNFDEWSADNEEELTCIFAETGADRELDFDRERAESVIYEKEATYKSQYPKLIWRVQL